MNWGTTVSVALVFIITSATGVEKRAVENDLFTTGKEYRYQYEVLVTTGTEEPVSFASSYRLKGILRVQGSSLHTLNVKLDNLTIGLYNGKWGYFPVPEFDHYPTEDLNSLSEPFQIVTEMGKFKTLVMNDQEPEWASNIKRGLATYLQMDLEQISLEKLEILKGIELTTMGECSTSYEVMPASASGTGLSRVNKFRNHADCPDVPTRVRYATKAHRCPDQNSRDIMNSTAYASYDLDQQGSQITVKRITVLSSILYWPFTTNGPFQYSWFNMTLALNDVIPIANLIEHPANPETHDELSYVFEQSDFSDPDEDILDLKSAEPLLFHHTTADCSPETLENTMHLCHKTIEEVAESLVNSNVFQDTKEFHKNSPFVIIPIISSLDYEHLKQCYTRYSEAAPTSQHKLTEYQLFLDGLLLSGTSASSLVIKDILLSTEDPAVLGRLATTFPLFIRYPSEILAKEFDPVFDLVNKSSLSKTTKRMIEFAMATLISRSCRKNGCQATGLMEKYINYFENKLTTSTSQEDQIVGIAGLRNIGKGRALHKVLEIATKANPKYEQTVRVQAIWSLRPLMHTEYRRLIDELLPVFFNRSESCEIRTSVFSFIMARPNKRTLHEVAYFMWTETCPQTANIVRSKLTNMANSKFLCNPTGTYAKTILKYLPPGFIDPKRTTEYIVDYYDQTYGFGHLAYAAVQKSGTSALPVSVYIGLVNHIAGYVNPYLGMYIRMQGLGKAITNKFAEMRSANIEEIEKLLSTIEVEERSDTPLRLELTLIYKDQVILYYAADENTLIRIPQLVKTLSELKSSLNLAWERSLILAGVLYQQPLEIGTPVSILVSATSIGGLSSNITRGRTGSTVTQETDVRAQLNVFGLSKITNHVPAIGTMHSITAHRTLRVRLPRHFKLGIDLKQSLVQFVGLLPTQSDPVIAQVHATSITSVQYDSTNRLKDHVAFERLKKSCSSCSPSTIVSRGVEFRKSRQLPIKLPSFIRGVQSGIKYFDCERDHSRSAVLGKIRTFFSASNKYAGFFDNPAVKLFLSIQHAKEFLFFSPYAETCGMSMYAYQDDSAPVKLDKVEVLLKYDRAKTVKSNLKASLKAKFRLKYVGTEASVTKLDLILSLVETDFNTQEMKIKLVASDPASGNHGVLCADITNYAKRFTKDGLCVKGENEPTAKQTIDIKMGRITGELTGNTDAKDVQCLTNHAEIKIIGEGKRSPEQVEESNVATEPSYAQCRAQKASSQYPGTFVPPSAECYAVAIDQTNLRTTNITITYKISEEVSKRWERPAVFLRSLLAPYLIDPEDDKVHQHNQHHIHSAASEDSKYYEGEVELDMNIKKDSTTLNVHYVGASGKELHYHDINLDFLPEALRPRPFPSRFSPLILLGFKVGAFGHCSVTPSFIRTLDNFSYAAALSECSTLISADCGRNPQYAVLARKISSERMAITIYMGEHKINLQGSLDPVIDGKAVTFPEKQVYTGGDDDIPAFQAIRNGDETYVYSLAQGVYIRYTGYFVTVALGSRYRGVHCGLCGTWDSSVNNDLRGPKSCPSPLGPNDMVSAYTLREGNCMGVGKVCP